MALDFDEKSWNVIAFPGIAELIKNAHYFRCADKNLKVILLKVRSTVSCQTPVKRDIPVKH